MKRLKLVSAAAAAVITTAGLSVAIPILTSGAVVTSSDCKTGMFGVAEASVSNLRVACVFASADSAGDAIKLQDFTNNTAWHDGASRLVKVTGVANSAVLTVASGAINIAGTFSPGLTGDENRTVEAGFNKLQPGSFIINESGAGIGGTITLSKPVLKSATYTLKIENGPGRTVSDVVTNGTTTITSATANFTNAAGISSDVGKSISGTGIPLGATISSVTNSTTAVMSAAATSSGSGRTITIAATENNSTHRMVTDMTINAGNTITSASAGFVATDIGLLVKGKGIPANAYITAVNSATNATLSAAATKASARIVAVIGLPSATAPIKDGVDTVATLQTEIVLNPSLVAGAPDCAALFAAGTDISGVWNSPSKMALKRKPTDALFYFNDAFMGLGNLSEQARTPLSSEPIIGQIQFKTPTVQFAGYVQQTTGGSATIVFPFLPTGIGQCSATDIVSVFSFAADMASQVSAPSGYGRPGSAGFRRTVALNAAGTSVAGTATIDSYVAAETLLTPGGGGNGLTIHNVGDTITTTGPHGLTEAQIVKVACGGSCTADGLKEATAYFVHVLDANTFQLTLTPFDGTVVQWNGVTVKAINIKVDDAAAVTVKYNTFNHQAGPFSTGCTVARPAPMTNITGSYPCSAG